MINVLYIIVGVILSSIIIWIVRINIKEKKKYGDPILGWIGRLFTFSIMLLVVIFGIAIATGLIMLAMDIHSYTGFPVAHGFKIVGMVFGLSLYLFATLITIFVLCFGIYAINKCFIHIPRVAHNEENTTNIEEIEDSDGWKKI